jgi:uncharacterized protein (TIGR03437 family)
MTIGGLDAPISFIGIPSWAVGVTQINFAAPANTPAGVQLLTVEVGSVVSPPVFFTVTQ